MFFSALTRNQALRPMLDPDSNAGASQAQTTADASTTTTTPAATGSAETPTPTQEAGTGTTSAPTAAPASTEQPAGTTDNAETTDAAGTTAGDEPAGDEPADLTLEQWRDKSKNNAKQAARYRTERNTARTQLAEAQTQITALEQQLSERPAAPDPVATAEAGRADAERRARIAEQSASAGVPMAAIQALRELDRATDDAGRQAALDTLRTLIKPATPGLSVPPTDTTGGPSIQEQIKIAEAKGDHRTSLRLKAQLVPKPQ